MSPESQYPLDFTDLIPPPPEFPKPPYRASHSELPKPPYFHKLPESPKPAPHVYSRPHEFASQHDTYNQFSVPESATTPSLSSNMDPSANPLQASPQSYAAETLPELVHSSHPQTLTPLLHNLRPEDLALLPTAELDRIFSLHKTLTALDSIKKSQAKKIPKCQTLSDLAHPTAAHLSQLLKFEVPRSFTSNSTFEVILQVYSYLLEVSTVPGILPSSVAIFLEIREQAFNMVLSSPFKHRAARIILDFYTQSSLALILDQQAFRYATDSLKTHLKSHNGQHPPLGTLHRESLLPLDRFHEGRIPIRTQIQSPPPRPKPTRMICRWCKSSTHSSRDCRRHVLRKKNSFPSPKNYR